LQDKEGNARHHGEKQSGYIQPIKTVPEIGVGLA
jgi:hypothetical protein